MHPDPWRRHLNYQMSSRFGWLALFGALYDFLARLFRVRRHG